MFIDEIIIKVTAGKGGDGCTSFRHEKYIELGGPDGGNGGKGADIIFKVDKNLKTLIDLKYQKHIKGDKGQNGEGSNRYGRSAEQVIVKVPEGTTIIDANTNQIIVDLINDGEEFLVCKAGRGGKGNKAFATKFDKAPRTSELGEPGEEKLIKCELHVLADIGLVGMPSVGKSSILALISASKPKIASYHFTTLNPNLGLVRLKDHRSFVIADLPGLIKGASEGVGLGDKFLKHTSRTKIIAHVLDMGSEEERNPITDYEEINEELNKYSDSLKNKLQIVIANKMDLPKAKVNLKNFKKKYPNINVIPISAINNEGIEEMLEVFANTLDNLIEKEEVIKIENHVLYKYEEQKPFTITKDNDTWVVKGDKIEKLFKMTRFDIDDSVKRFALIIKKMGVEEELEVLGAKKGDEVKILDYIFVFKS